MKCETCRHDERDHIVDPMSKIAWCGLCHDEFVPRGHHRVDAIWRSRNERDFHIICAECGEPVTGQGTVADPWRHACARSRPDPHWCAVHGAVFPEGQATCLVDWTEGELRLAYGDR